MDEICDGKDNDCNGDADDLGTTTCGKGLCAHTIDNCVAGETQICDPLKGAVDEICDGKDNDCDGDADEDLGTTTCGKGLCLHTVDNCVGGEIQNCDPFEGASDEVCDELDNDCDGKIDAEDDSVIGLCAEGDSCLTILENKPEVLDGYYAIDPIGNGDAFLAFCNMSEHGGGRTLTASISASNDNHTLSGAVDTDNDGVVRDDGKGEKLADPIISALWTDRIWVEINGGSGDIHCELSKQPPGSTTWTTIGAYTCGYTFNSTTNSPANQGGCACGGPEVWLNYDYRAYDNPYQGCKGAAATFVPSGAGGCGNHPARSGALWIR